MLKALKVLALTLIAAVVLGALALGGAWLLADRWDDRMSPPAAAQADLPEVGWAHYANDAGGSKFSPATQVWPENVGRLAPVWVFRTGETGEGYTSAYKHTFQATPILVGRTLYFSTAFL